MSYYSRGPKPIESLHDERIQEIMSLDYDIDTDATYQDEIYQNALNIANGDDVKARKVYQELRRTIDGLRVIDTSTTDIDQASRVVDMFIHLGRLRIEVIMHPEEPPLPPIE